jgi:hypothetical protein
MADLYATTKIEILMIPVCWAEFHIKHLKRKASRGISLKTKSAEIRTMPERLDRYTQIHYGWLMDQLIIAVAP